MDVDAVIAKIQLMKLDQNEKDILVAELKEKGEAAIPDVLVLLELKARNAENAASTVQSLGDELVSDIQDAVASADAPSNG